MELQESIALEALRYFIVAVGLLMCYAEVRQALRLKHVNYAWVKWSLGVMGLYWSIYYFLSIIESNYLVGHQVFVRAPLLLTLSLVAAGAILSLKRGR